MSDTEYAIIPSDKESKKKILDAFMEISNAQVRIEAERDYIKESFNMLHDEFKIPKKMLRKLWRLEHKGNAADVVAETEETVAALEMLTGKSIES